MLTQNRSGKQNSGQLAQAGTLAARGGVSGSGAGQTKSNLAMLQKPSGNALLAAEDVGPMGFGSTTNPSAGPPKLMGTSRFRLILRIYLARTLNGHDQI